MVQPLGTRDNILFDTAWNKSAKLADLENDNLVVPDIADGLCSGILDKGPIEKSLKPWLHGNPMPIAGVVIAATGERLSIKSGIHEHITYNSSAAHPKAAVCGSLMKGRC